MPFTKTDLAKEIETQRETDPEFRRAWDERREEYRLIGEMVKLRNRRKLRKRSKRRDRQKARQELY
ncbi:MAG: hypothetical protein LUG99_14330 [Lachnospiraceae bacterium]|nr:hypothetical protein [Lachnospiraceae bacterium]